MKKGLIVAAGLALVLAACQDNGGGTQTQPRKDIVLTQAEEQLVTENTDFAFRLFGQVCQPGQGQGNLFISPPSTSFTLSMVANGASGGTREELLEALGFDGDDLAGLNTLNHKLLTTLPTLDNTSRLEMANSVWVQQGTETLPDFARTNQEMYAADIRQLDFDQADAVRAVNEWCSERTQGLIPQAVDRFAPNTVLYLLNALYFKGQWKTQFKRGDTRQEVFHNGDNTQSTVPMMHLSGKHFPFASNDGFRIAWLPYGNEAFSMCILLPAEGKTLDECLPLLTAGNWQKWTGERASRELDLKLPRFSVTHNRDLQDDLQALGIQEAFDPARADFSSLAENSLYLTGLTQATRLAVDEEGTEAASASGTGGGETAASPTLDFHVDRPFVFMITEYSTGSILFMGKVDRL